MKYIITDKLNTFAHEVDCDGLPQVHEEAIRLKKEGLIPERILFVKIAQMIDGKKVFPPMCSFDFKRHGSDSIDMEGTDI